MPSLYRGLAILLLLSSSPYIIYQHSGKYYDHFVRRLEFANYTNQIIVINVNQLLDLLIILFENDGKYYDTLFSV